MTDCIRDFFEKLFAGGELAMPESADLTSLACGNRPAGAEAPLAKISAPRPFRSGLLASVALGLILVAGTTSVALADGGAGGGTPTGGGAAGVGITGAGGATAAVGSGGGGGGGGVGTTGGMGGAGDAGTSGATAAGGPGGDSVTPTGQNGVDGANSTLVGGG